MDVKELMQGAFTTAKKKGWWDKGKRKTVLECLMMAVTELGEAVEELRTPTLPPIYQIQIQYDGEAICVTPQDKCYYRETGEVYTRFKFKWDPGIKPEGWVIEIADCLIRLADTCAHEKVDLVKALELKMAYNKMRDYRHGNKKY